MTLIQLAAWPHHPIVEHALMKPGFDRGLLDLIYAIYILMQIGVMHGIDG